MDKPKQAANITFGKLTQDASEEDFQAHGVVVKRGPERAIFLFKAGSMGMPLRDPSKPAWTECPCARCGQTRAFRTELTMGRRKPVCAACKYRLGETPDADA